MDSNRPMLRGRRFFKEGQHSERYSPDKLLPHWPSSPSSTCSTMSSSSEMPRSIIKNTASARMKRLREGLATELKASPSDQDMFSEPTPKRFASVSESNATSSSTNQVFNKHSDHRERHYHMKKPPTKSPHTSPLNRVSNHVNNSPVQTLSVPSTSSQPPIVNHEQRKIVDHKNPKKFPYRVQDRPSLSVRMKASHSSPVKFKPNSTSGKDTMPTQSTNNNRTSFNHNLYNSPPVPQNNNSNMDEEMEWSPISEEILLANLRQGRDTVYQTANLMPTTNTKSSIDLSSNNIYVVVDTNIFIDKLQTIINIMHIAFSDESYPVIFVPWMVIQELDYFKDGYSVSEKHPVSRMIQTRCRKAVKFINDCLIARKVNFKGQSVHQAAERQFNVQNADDSILACCLQLISEKCKVILLSSDTNLRNKAIISEITALSPAEIVNELGKRKLVKTRCSLVQEVSKKLSLLCSFVLHFEIRAFYGDDEYRRMFKLPPWSYKECVKHLHDHFTPALEGRIQKQCRKVIDDLYEMFYVNEEIVNEVKFMELSLALLIYLQNGLSEYETNIQNTIDELKKLEDGLLNK